MEMRDEACDARPISRASGERQARADALARARATGRARLLLGAAGVCGMLVIPITVAGAAGEGPQATASAVSAAKFKKLKKQVQELEQKVDDLQLQPGPQGPQGPQAPEGPQGPQGSPAASALMGNVFHAPVAADGTTFGEPSGESSAGPEASRSALTPNSPILARDLAVVTTGPPGIGSSWTFTLRDNSADTAVSCTIGASSTSCNSGDASATIAAGHVVSLKMVPSGTPAASTQVKFGWRALSP
jgi:hypothetical protein